MKNKTVAILLISMCFMLLTGCNHEPKTVYKSDSVEIVKEGHSIAVYDLVTDNTYHCRTKLVKRSEGDLKAYTAVDTDTLRIDIIQRGLQVYDKTENEIFRIKRKVK